MATNRFICVHYMYNGRLNDARRKAFQKTCSLAPDWVGMDRHKVTILYTADSIDRWYIRLREHLQAGELLLISEFHLEGAEGLLPKWIWAWLLADRADRTFVEADEAEEMKVLSARPL